MTTEAHSHPAQRGIRTTLIGILANAVLAIIKGAAGFLGNSYALIADAIESSSDILSSLVIFTGLRIAAKPRDMNHPYGHGKAEPLAAILVALALFSAAIIIVIQSIKEVITPHHAPAAFTLVVLFVAIVAKESLYRIVYRVGKDIHSIAVRTDAWHHRSDAITSAAAFVGITVALVGGEGFESADDLAAMFVSAIIAYNAYRLFLPAVGEVMDVAPSPHIEEELRRVAGAVDGVRALDKCLVRKMGLEYYVDLHVVVDGSLSVERGHEIGHTVKDAIRASNPKITDVLVHVEPDSVLKSNRP
jgi:cation diffusion facilitator family transporter